MPFRGSFVQVIVPLAVLNSLALASANSAYLYITVAFAQAARRGPTVRLVFRNTCL